VSELSERRDVIGDAAGTGHSRPLAATMRRATSQQTSLDAWCKRPRLRDHDEQANAGHASPNLTPAKPIKPPKDGRTPPPKRASAATRQLTLAPAPAAATTVLTLSHRPPPPPEVPLHLPPREVFEYHLGFYSESEARRLYRELAALPQWSLGSLRIHGELRQLNRLCATFAVDPTGVVRYSGRSEGPAPLADAPAVARILRDVQAWAAVHGLQRPGDEHRINYVLLNYYRNGDDYVSLHGDYLTDMAGPVYSLSFQDTDDVAQLRAFDIVDNASAHKVRIRIANGSLMVMQRAFHVLYKHGVPPQRGCTAGRINVTCRCVRLHAPPAVQN